MVPRSGGPKDDGIGEAYGIRLGYGVAPGGHDPHTKGVGLGDGVGGGVTVQVGPGEPCAPACGLNSRQSTKPSNREASWIQAASFCRELLVGASGGSFWWELLVGASGGSFWWELPVGASGGSFRAMFS
jgi:hypothetical protein